MEMEEINNVCHPKHYNQGGIECIDAIKAAVVGKTGIEAFCVGNAIKYLFRYEKKNGLEDVKKAQWYINRLIQELEEKKKNNALHNPNAAISIGDCNDCAYVRLSERSEPCCNCKNTAIPNTPEYDRRPLLFKWRD